MRQALENLVGAAPARNRMLAASATNCAAFAGESSNGQYLDIDQSQRRNGGLWRLLEAKEGTHA